VVSASTIGIAGIGRTEYSRNSGRTTLAMAAEACRAAVADSSLSLADVDGMICFAAGDSVGPLAVSQAIGLPELAWNVDVMGGGNVVANVIATAAAAITAGLCHSVLVYRSLNGRSGHRFGTATGRLEVGGGLQFEAPHGYLVPPQWIAMWARRHQHVYGSTCEDLGEIAITQRAHAVANPHAINRTPLTMDDYLAGRWVNEPFRIFDCAYEVDGAVAVLLTGADVLASSGQPPVWLIGSADSQSGIGWTEWEDPTSMYSRRAAPRLWDRTGMGPADVDVACMYDCFTYTVMATMEDYGFCGKGEAGEFFARGRATYGGDVVVNPHGGLLSEGYIHGLNHYYEAVVQLRGQAGARQVEGARTALVTAGAGPYGGASVLSAAQL
jgi:acetyl-CoA acetyltransferase